MDAMYAGAPRAEATDALVADLYRAAAGELPWERALAAMRSMFGAWDVHLHGVCPADGTVAFSFEVGDFPPHGVLAYASEYHRIDPRAALVMRLGLGQWISCHHHFDDSFVAHNRFYQDFLIPYGGRYVSCARVYEDAGIVCILGIRRGRDMQPLSDEQVLHIERIGRHVTTALGLWRRQGRLLEHCALGSAVIERIAHAVLLIDTNARVHHANAAAQRLLEAGQPMRLVDGRLELGPPKARQELAQALGRLGAGDTRSPQRAIVRVERPLGPLALVLSALPAGRTMGAFGLQDRVMVLVHDTRRRCGADRFMAGAVFDLTPAEAAVAVAVAEGRTPAAIAADHGVALSTVRAQLSAVYAKMDVKRQSELVAALASLPPAPTD